MFINLSNHPSDRWGKAHQEIARENYREIVDMPFPQVTPDASNDELQILAQEYVQRIMSLTKSQTVTVHIMGEMTFTFMVITRLKEMGIKCVASTTERKTTYNDDGTKVSEFQFVKFREY